MKNFLSICALFLVFTLSISESFAGNLEFVSKDEAVTGTIDDIIVATAVVKNNSMISINVDCYLTIESLADNHSLIICWNNCFADITTSRDLGVLSIAAGKTSGNDFHVELDANETPGTTVLKFKFYNVLDSEDFIEFQTSLTATPTSGVEDTQQPSVLVYPNPTSEYLYFVFPASVTENTTFDIYSPCGALVKSISSQSASGAAVIPVSDLPEGVYVVSFLDGAGKRVVRNFVVVK
jgi:hypothetical protein